MIIFRLAIDVWSLLRGVRQTRDQRDRAILQWELPASTKG